MALYHKTISESEAYFSLEEGKLVKSGGGQSSYNLPRYFFKYATERGILIEDPNITYSRNEIDGNAYVLSENYEFHLGKSVLSLIGEDYGNVDNKFIASLNGTNNKFQIYRKVYDKMGWRYGWFVELYDRNLSGNTLILDLDEKNEVFTIDIIFNGIKRSEYHELIKKFII